MDFNEKIFNDSKVKAPDNFVEKTMDYIYHQEMLDIQSAAKKTSSYNPPFLKLGKAMVMAALLLVIFNILPTFGGISTSNAGSESNISFNMDENKNTYYIDVDTSEITEIKNLYTDFKNKINFDFTNIIKGE